MTESPLGDRPPDPLRKRPPGAPPPASSPAPATTSPVADGGADAGEPAVRASDADRDRIAAILGEALAEGRLDPTEHAERLDATYGAKTQGELAPLVRDLPDGRAEESVVREGAAAPPIPADGRTDNLVAVFSGTVRKGQYSVPAKINAVACFGSVEIDLTNAVFEHQYVQINATAVFGSVDIRVPPNITLRQKGAGIFGGFEIHTAESSDPDAPVVLVQGAAVFGGVQARPKWTERLRKFYDRHLADRPLSPAERVHERRERRHEEARERRERRRYGR